MMNMKTYSKIFSTMVGMLFLFTACEDAIQDRENSPVMPESCLGVYFPTTNPAVVELEPTEPTQITITIARTDSVSAAEVPITVVTNTDDVFVVPAKAVFAAGAKTTTLTVAFPKADEGITYKLKLSVSGDEYVSQYASTIPYVSTSVTRIKWSVMDEPFVFVDGIAAFGYSLDPIPMYVTAEEARLATVVRYRFKNIYKQATDEPDADKIYTGYPDPKLEEYPIEYIAGDHYMIIEIDSLSGQVSMFQSNTGIAFADFGMIITGSVYGNLSTDIESYPLGTFGAGKEGNIITFPPESLFFIENSDMGAIYVCSTPTVIYTTKKAYLAANMKIDNFNKVEYEEIESGAVSEFESAAYSDSWSQSIAKAIDIDPDNEDSEYKNLYYLANLYAEDFGLAFYYDGKSVSIPEEQKTGRLAFGKEVYVSQSETIESSVTTNSKGVDIYTLGLTFHFEDGTVIGEFAEVFYYSKEPVSYELTDFYGAFTLTGKSLWAEDANMNITIAAGTEENTFVITGISFADSVVAKFDPQTSVMSIVPQALPDYEEYDISLYTYISDDEISDSVPILFTFNMSGQLTLASNSEAIGYLLYSEVAGNWVDGYINLAFIPQAVAETRSIQSVAAIQGIVAKPLSGLQNVISAAKSQKGSTDNFAIKGKASTKTMSKRVRTPFF
jgi:hypothetical protein